MRPHTKTELMHLQTYGTMYLSNIEPVDIELMYLDPRMNTFDALENTLSDPQGRWILSAERAQGET